MHAGIASLQGWRRWLAAFLAGALAAAAMPPVYAFPLLVPAFSALFLLVSAAAPRRAFADGWWFGFGFFTAGLYWICISLFTDPDKFLWLLPFALFGVPSALALYPALAMLAYARLRTRSGILNLCTFASLWTMSEYLRGSLLGGFPWNLIGYSWTAADAAMQPAAWIGTFGLSWLTVLVAASAALLWEGEKNARRIMLCSWMTVALLLLGGAWRLHRADAQPLPATGVKLRLVQADIRQPHKWDPKRQREEFERYLALSRTPGLDNVRAVIWPETAMPFVLSQQSPLIEPLRTAAPLGGLLLTGALRAEGKDASWRVWNSLAVIDPAHGLLKGYDKWRLVPFGEFVPLRFLLPNGFILPAGSTDFSTGKGPVTLHLEGLPLFSPLICYEAIFPDSAVDARDRPAWLLNITNDAWFGISFGPYQHLAMARMRAVEQGMPLVRAANTGISAVTDAYGRVRASLPLMTEGILDAELPPFLPQPSLYARVGDVPLFALIIVNIGFIVCRRRKR